VLSVPNGKRLAAAFDKLDFMVSIDIYVNETTRHADFILPPAGTWPRTTSTCCSASSPCATSRVVTARGERAEGELADWEILLELSRSCWAAARMGRALARPPTRWLRPSACVGLDGVLEPATAAGGRTAIASCLVGRSQPRKAQGAPHGIDLVCLQPGANAA